MLDLGIGKKIWLLKEQTLILLKIFAHANFGYACHKN